MRESASTRPGRAPAESRSPANEFDSIDMIELPNLHDGLQPVQAAILRVLGAARGPTRSARVITKVVGSPTPALELGLMRGGEVEANEPHLAAYLALVWLAQPFQTRYPLIEGTGNFGSVDGDPPADAAFTKASLSPFGRAVHQGLGPHLLVNGCAGCLPHNLREIAEAARRLVLDPDISDEALLAAIAGPDFPTGGVVLLEGRDTVVVGARVEVDSQGAIVVSELPFTVRKADVIAEMSEALRRGALAGIDDVRDESDPDGIRIVLPLRSGVAPAAALAEVSSLPGLAISLAIDMRVNVDGEARRVDLPALLRAYVGQLAELFGGTAEPVKERSLRAIEAIAVEHGDARRTSISLDLKSEGCR